MRNVIRFLSSKRVMGVVKEVLKAGDGVNFPKPGNTVTMHYKGTFTDGALLRFALLSLGLSKIKVPDFALIYTGIFLISPLFILEYS